LAAGATLRLELELSRVASESESESAGEPASEQHGSGLGRVCVPGAGTVWIRQQLEPQSRDAGGRGRARSLRDTATGRGPQWAACRRRRRHLPPARAKRAGRSGSGGSGWVVVLSGPSGCRGKGEAARARHSARAAARGELEAAGHIGRAAFSRETRKRLKSWERSWQEKVTAVYNLYTDDSRPMES
jgi:hypothetical protein